MPILLFAQQAQFSPPFPDSVPLTDYELLGNNGKNIYVLATPPVGNPLIRVYDTDLKFLNEETAPLLKDGSVLSCGPDQQGLRMLAEYDFEKVSVYKSIRVDALGKTSLEKDIVSLPEQAGKTWNCMSSPRRHYILFYLVNPPANDSIVINTVLLDSNWDLVKMGSADIPYSAEFDRLNRPALDDAGTVFVTSYDQPLNYKLGSTVRIYRYGINENDWMRREFYIRENKPVDFLFRFDPGGAGFSLHALYTNFYSKRIEGLIQGSFSPDLKEILPFTPFPFGKEIRKDLRRMTVGITADDLPNFLSLYRVSPGDSGTCYITSGLDYLGFRAFADATPGKAGTRPVSLQENNPLRTAATRDLYMRPITPADLHTSRSITRYGSTYPAAGNRTPANRATNNPMGYYNNQIRNIPVTATSLFAGKKVFNKYFFFAFNNRSELNWYQYFLKESAMRSPINHMYLAETGSALVALRYEHDSKEKYQFRAAILDKSSGKLKEVAVPVPDGTGIVLSKTIIQLSGNSYVLLYAQPETGNFGIAKIGW